VGVATLTAVMMGVARAARPEGPEGPEGPDVDFRLLGPLEVRVRGRLVPVTSPKLRVLLAALVLNASRPVTVGELAAARWGAGQPANPRRATQLAVVRLRAVLDAAGCRGLIRTRPESYLLEVPDQQTDLGRFRHRLREADRAAERSDRAAEADALRAALAEWRGELLSDLSFEHMRHRLIQIQEQRLHVLERRFDADLRLGRHDRIVAELIDVTAEHPLRERFWAQMMTALHRAGRRADALAAYHSARRHLADELGVDPGEELTRVHATVLGGLRSPDTGSVLLPSVPRQLPAAVSSFAGRTGAVSRLDTLLPAGEWDGDGPATVMVISGTAGVGKTALALHWARRVAHRFPDGQLWADLRGYDHRPALTAGEALTLLLRGLGVPDASVPSDLDGRSALYRSLLDGRRVLVVVDNAAAAEQVRPLLPGGSGPAVIITSRDPLTGLVAGGGAQTMVLDRLTAAESRELLVRRLGAQRVDAGPAAVAEIVDRCARLPLALSVATARAAQQPGLRLDRLAAQLRAAPQRLDEFSSPDPATDVRAVFSWSYRTLSEPAARLFRLSGVHPAPDMSTDTLAALAGTAPAALRPLVRELSDAHLIAEHAAGRWVVHDLLRIYAAELADSHDPSERHGALQRVFDHYLHSAHAAAMLIEPWRAAIVLQPADPVASARAPIDRDDALAWFGREHDGLLAAVERAGHCGFDTHAWQLAWTLAGFQQWRGLWRDRAACLTIALASARRLGDTALQARAHRGLGYAYTRLARHEDANLHLRQSLDLYDRLGDRAGRARAHHGLSYLLERQDDRAAALWHAERALVLYPPDGNPADRARAVSRVGRCHSRVGRHRLGLRYNRCALALLDGTCDHVAEAAVWDDLGYAHHNLGDHQRAAACYETALHLWRKLGHRYGEANTLTHLGGTPAGASEDVIHAGTGESDADRLEARPA
jgi:DNA-binding SARP family transcriptional activator/tetratricopeptide (TPR) repeat protein